MLPTTAPTETAPAAVLPVDPPSYADAASTTGADKRTAALRPGEVGNPYGFGREPSFQDSRYDDGPADRLYPRWRASPQWSRGFKELPVKDLLALADECSRRQLPWNGNDILWMLNVFASLVAIAPKPGIPRVQSLMDPEMLVGLSTFCSGQAMAGHGLMAEDTRARCRAIVVQYVRLLAAAIDERELDPDQVLNALSLGGRDGKGRSGAHAPLLLSLASAAAADTNSAMALCDLFCSCKNRTSNRPSFSAGVVKSLLETRDARGLAADDKYDTFYGRVFGDGSEAGRPGAPIVAYRLRRLGFMPSTAQVTATHSALRAAKWDLCGRRGDAWGGGQAQGPRTAPDLVGQAARLHQRVHVEFGWARADAGHFAAVPRVPGVLEHRPVARVRTWLRSLRGDPRRVTAPTVSRSTAASPTAPAASASAPASGARRS